MDHDAERGRACSPSGGGVSLEPFDELLLADSRHDFPMTFFLECRIAGAVASDRFRRAVQEASRRHPRLRSRVVRRVGRAVWLSPDVEPVVVTDDDHDPDPWRRIDLTRESGVRIVVRSRSGGITSVTLVVHHAACDGIAACEYLDDIWSCYDGVPMQGFSRGRGRDPSPAAPRGDGPLGEAIRFMTFQPAALRPVVEPGDSAVTRSRVEPPFAVVSYDALATARLHEAARRRQATVNDLVLAAVARASAAWIEAAGRRAKGVRITMPVNIRPPGSRQPACNGIGYAFLDRSVGASLDRDVLVADFAAASRWIVSSGAAVRFNEALELVSRLPWALRLVSRLPGCRSTVIVSNLGDVSRRMREGEAPIDVQQRPIMRKIVGYAGVPPLRPGTNAAIGIMRNRETLNVCCASSVRRDPREGGRVFLDLVVRELDAFAPV